jgi:hypothetical protein
VAMIQGTMTPLAGDDVEGRARFRALLDEVSTACSNVAERVHGRDRAGLLMAAALLRLDLAELDREVAQSSERGLVDAPCGRCGPLAVNLYELGEDPPVPGVASRHHLCDAPIDMGSC